MFDKYVKEIEKHNAMTGSNAFPHGLIQTFSTVMDLAAMDDPESYFVSLDLLYKALEKYPKAFSNNNIFSTMSSRRFIRISATWNFVAKSPYVKAFADYRVYELPYDSSSMMAMLFSRIRAATVVPKKKFLKKS